MKLDEVVAVDVDMDIAPQCEHSEHGRPWHGGDARYLIGSSWPCCGTSQSFLICHPAWEDAHGADVFLLCPGCHADYPANEVWRIITVL